MKSTMRIFQFVMLGMVCVSLAGCPLAISGGGGGTWAKTYGGTDDQAGNSVSITPGGDYFILSGITLLKLKSNGTVLLRRNIAVDREDANGLAVNNLANGRATADGGFIAIGTRTIKDDDGNHSDIYLVKVDGDGLVEWTSNLGNTPPNDPDDGDPAGNETGVAVDQILTDGEITGYVAVGNTRSYRVDGDTTTTDADVFVATVDATGVEQGSAIFGEASTDSDSYDETAADVRQAGDGFIVAANQAVQLMDGNDVTRSDNDAYLLYLDSELAATFETTYGETERDEALASAAPIIEGGEVAGFVAAGSWNTNFLPYTGKQVAGYGDTDVYILKVAADGTETWAFAYGTEDSEAAYGVQVARDGYIVCGVTDSMNVNDMPDALLMKVDADGASKWTSTFGSYGYDYLTSLALDGSSIVACGAATWKVPYANNTDIDDLEIYVLKASSTGQVSDAGRSDPEMEYDRK